MQNESGNPDSRLGDHLRRFRDPAVGACYREGEPDEQEGQTQPNKGLPFIYPDRVIQQGEA